MPWAVLCWMCRHAAYTNTDGRCLPQPRMFIRVGQDVVEVLSRPRAAHDAGMQRCLGMQPKLGWPLAPTTIDHLPGNPWDLRQHDVRSRAGEMGMG